MANLLCLEPVGGIAGDMFLGLALDLGVALAQLEAGLAPLGPLGYRLVVTREKRHAIAGTRVEVALTSPASGHAHRPYAEIRSLLERTALPARVKEVALAVFGRLAEAEGRIHGVAAAEVSFHEVGAVDSIVDIVGAAVCLALLGWPDVVSSPPPLGSGLIQSAHGMIPVPAPATVELLRERAVRFEGVGELTTPTGAALIAGLTREGPFPPLVLDRVGYGVGTRDPADRPNLLRGLLGRRPEGGATTLWVIEANLDDVTPQILSFALDALLAAGARDAWIAPVTMKKGRPGHVLSALAGDEARAKVAEVMLRETTALGVRAAPVERMELARRFETIKTGFGTVRIKIGELRGETVSATPEYEDCAQLAREKDVPLKEVIAAAMAVFRTRGEGGPDESG
jgi:uncharacterized protein (TIGR00299 family) protein